MQNTQPIAETERRILDGRARGGDAFAAMVEDLARRQAHRLTPELIAAIKDKAIAWRSERRSILLRGREGMAFDRALLLVGYDDPGSAIRVLALRPDGLLVDGISDLVTLRPNDDGLHARVDALVPSLPPADSREQILTHRSAWIGREAQWTVKQLILAIKPLTEQAPEPDTGQSAAIEAASRDLEYASFLSEGHTDTTLSSHERMRLIRGVLADPILARNFDPDTGGPRHEKAAQRETTRRNGLLNRRREREGTLIDGLGHRLAHRERRRLGLAVVLLQRRLDPAVLRIMRRVAYYTPAFYNMLVGLKDGVPDTTAAARRQSAANAFPLLAAEMSGCPTALAAIDDGMDPADALSAGMDADRAVIRRLTGLNWQRCGRAAFHHIHRVIAVAGRVRAANLRLSTRQDWSALLRMLGEAEQAANITGLPPRRWLDEWLALDRDATGACHLAQETIGWIALTRDRLIVPLAVQRILARNLPLSMRLLCAVIGQQSACAVPGSIIAPAIGADRRSAGELNQAATQAQELLSRSRRQVWNRGIIQRYDCDSIFSSDLPPCTAWPITGRTATGDGWTATPCPPPTAALLGTTAGQWYRIDVLGHTTDILFDRVHIGEDGATGIGPCQQANISAPGESPRTLPEIEPLFRSAVAATAAAHAESLASQPATRDARVPVLRAGRQQRVLRLLGIDVGSHRALEDEYQTIRPMLPDDVRGRSLAEWRRLSAIDAVIDAAIDTALKSAAADESREAARMPISPLVPIAWETEGEIPF